MCFLEDGDFVWFHSLPEDQPTVPRSVLHLRLRDCSGDWKGGIERFFLTVSLISMDHWSFSFTYNVNSTFLQLKRILYKRHFVFTSVDQSYPPAQRFIWLSILCSNPAFWRSRVMFWKLTMTVLWSPETAEEEDVAVGFLWMYWNGNLLFLKSFAVPWIVKMCWIYLFCPQCFNK